MTEVDSVPVAQKASWSSFLKTIISASGDLSSLSAPSFILSPVSLSEFPSYWGEPTAQFNAIALEGKTPEERQILVTKWFLSTLAGQFTRREKETGSEKKPLNPVLGEVFRGWWGEGEGKTVLEAEQVSHHPPITAYHLATPSLKLSLSGHCAQKTSFTGRTIVVKQVGHGIITLDLGGGEIEKWLITLPKLIIEGILYGKPYVELCEHSYIQSSTGFTTKIEYRGKGWVSGHAHGFTATITTPHSSSSKPLHTIEGHWTTTSQILSPSLSKTPRPFLSLSDLTSTTPIKVKPIDVQDEFESRRIWKDVAKGIREGDFERAGAVKATIEESERRKRKEEKEEGREWALRGFEKRDEAEDYEKLASLCHHKPEREESYVFIKTIS